MKKLLAIVMAVMTVFSCAVVASATTVNESSSGASSQTLTVEYTAPDVTYTVSIPASLTLDLAEGTEFTITDDAGTYNYKAYGIGKPEVTASENFGGRTLDITINASNPFKIADGDFAVPFTLGADITIDESATHVSGVFTPIRFVNEGPGDDNTWPLSTQANLTDPDGALNPLSNLTVDFVDGAWGGVPSGTYTSTVTYTISVNS